MEHFLKLRPVVRAYVLAVVAVGALTVALSARSLTIDPIGSEWLLLAGLTILTGSFSVKVPSINAYISVSEAFVFASVLLFGAEAGTVTVLLECLVILLWMKPQGRPVYRMFFNMAAPSVAIWIAGTGFYWLSGIQPYSEVFTPLPRLFIPLLAFTATYFLFNSWLVAIAVGLETQRSAIQIWWKNFAWLSVNYFSGASVAALIVTYTQRLDFSTLAVIVPLLVVSYLTFRTAMGRAEDSYNHLSELNRLYLSTIETLAMAIDAKDQITHGHIRRVQLYAVGLAKRIGIADEKLLKAIEAAALLHDMGKLAVPEHILNKPGKLTPAEFEKMKLHAGVGADILSAIDFPYPVVPIVRHHHENWDGTGYPTGIRGTEIPIGARILSVVDCFDALTSDRPYRPKLSDDEAIAILLERRGTMYDPLVVDTFIRVHKDIAPESTSVHVSRNGFAQITNSATSGREPAQASDLPESSQPQISWTLADAARSTEKPAEQALSALRLEAIGCRLAILFKYDAASDELVPAAIDGESVRDLWDLRIALGERLSGWVGANRRAIVNSDPALDLGDFAKAAGNGLASTLSVPLVVGRDLVGVLSLYSEKTFSDRDRLLAEQLARPFSERLAKRDVQKREGAESSKPDRAPGVAPVSSLIWIEILNWEELYQDLDDDARHHLLGGLSAAIKSALSSSDLLVRYKDEEFVALLARADAKDVRTLANSIRRVTSSLRYGPKLDRRVDIAVGAVIAPMNVGAFWELLESDFGAKLASEPRVVH